MITLKFQIVGDYFKVAAVRWSFLSDRCPTSILKTTGYFKILTLFEDTSFKIIYIVLYSYSRTVDSDDSLNLRFRCKTEHFYFLFYTDSSIKLLSTRK